SRLPATAFIFPISPYMDVCWPCAAAARAIAPTRVRLVTILSSLISGGGARRRPCFDILWASSYAQNICSLSWDLFRDVLLCPDGARENGAQGQDRLRREDGERRI